MLPLLTLAALQAVLALPASELTTEPLSLSRPSTHGDFQINGYNSNELEYFDVPSYYPGYPYYRLPESSRPNICYIKAARNGGDSAPAIQAAFKKCSANSRIVFNDTLYHVNSVMNTTGLSNVEVDVRGTLLWSTNITYWLTHSLPVGYQNQSSAWFFGGNNVWLHGNGVGTLNGNGQVWYDFIGAASNYNRRPHAITFSKLTNSVVEGMRFIQSQMWTMTLIHSSNVLLQDIYVNNTNVKGGYDQNTDGADTIYANNIAFRRWTIQNGDDSISMKANSSNMLIENCTFHYGGGLAMGSIGQYYGRYEFIENVTARDIYVYRSSQVGYVKTWTGVQKGYPPNGGGGGIGHVKNITFSNFTVSNIAVPWYITQCTSYNGQKGDCDTSKFQIEDLYWSNVKGTVAENKVVDFQCSGAAPCRNIHVSNTNVKSLATGKQATQYLCSNVTQTVGFKCNGVTSVT